MPTSTHLAARVRKVFVFLSIFSLVFSNMAPVLAAESAGEESADGSASSEQNSGSASDTAPTIQLDGATEESASEDQEVKGDDSEDSSKGDFQTNAIYTPQGQDIDDSSVSVISRSLSDDLAKAHQQDVQQNTGNLVYNYPISIPPGRNGMQPDLKLVYESQGVSVGSLYGVKWTDNIPYIQRYAKRGVDQLYSPTTSQYFTSYWDGELATTTNSGLYVARTENGDFRSYVFTSSTNQWVVTDKKGTRYKFGYSTSTRQDDPDDESHVYKWMLEEARDTNDNYIKYTYSKDLGAIYPTSIIYTGNGVTDGTFEINFATSTRTDTVTSTRSGFKVVPQYIINRIDVKNSGSLVHQYSFGYATSDNGTLSLLSTAVETGKDEFNNTVTEPTTTFSYQTQIPGWSSSSTWYPPAQLLGSLYDDRGYRVADINGDGLADIIRGFHEEPSTDYFWAYINNGNGWDPVPSWSPPVILADYLGDKGCRILDVNGDGLVDIICGFFNGTSNFHSAYINNGHGWTADSSWNPPVEFSDSSKRDRGYKIADFNGDGLPDFIRAYNVGFYVYEAWINNGHGWTNDHTWDPPTVTTDGSWHDKGCRAMDVNGDGLADIIRGFWDGTSYTYSGYINNGHGFDPVPTWYSPVVFANYATDDFGYRIMDVNGDGLPEMIRSYETGPGTFSYEALINNGHGWTSDPNWYPPILTWINNGKDTGFVYTDVNGDGMADMIRSFNNGSYVYDAWINKGRATSLLAKVTYPQGGSLSFAYKRAAQYLDSGVANQVYASIPTVSDVVTNDGSGMIATTTYAYGGGMYYYNNPFDNRFAGFATTTVMDPQGNVTKTYFHQGNYSNSGMGEYSDDYSKIGKPYRIERYDGNGNLFQKTINKWDSSAVASSTAAYVKLAQTVDYTYDGGGSHKDKAEAYTYDGTNGNQTQKVEYGLVTGSDDGTFSDSGSDLFTTNISYASSATSTVIGAVKQATVLDQSSVQVKDTKYYYDGLSFGSIDKGNQTKGENWKVSSTYINSQKSYNNFGLVAASTDPRGKVTTYSYDDFNLYPATTTDPLGYKTQYAYDYSVGKPKKVTDANGLVTQTLYDGLGRKVQVFAPDLATSSTQELIESFVYTDTAGAYSIKDSKQLTSTSTADSYLYYDGLGRLIQSRSAAATSTGLEVKDLFYNDLGLLAAESLPYYSSGNSRTTATTSAALLSSYSYDAVQRLKTSSNILGNTTTTYNLWQTTITDPNGKTKDLVYDAYKRLVEVDEHNSTSTYVTVYQYDGKGGLTKITDALGNVRNFTYDGLGRRLTAEDLHAVGDGTFGSWSYTYDDNGNLTTLVDPKSQTINYTYDDVNRPLTEDYTGQGGIEVTYTYDNCAFGIGSLCTASSTALTIVNAYNPLRLLASETKTIDGTGYTTQYTYDRQGNQITITNPDSSQIKYGYAGGRFLHDVSKKETTDGGFVPIVNSFDYAPNEQVSRIAFANGVTETNTYDPAKLYRLTNKISTLPNASQAQNLSYTYDAVGNITQLVEGASSTQRTVNYGYDDLYRLTSAAATGTPSGVSGYNQTFSYDALGNILSSDQGSYAYAGTSYANPDAATTIGGLSLAYDNNGNLTGMSGSATSTLGWDYLNRLTQDAVSSTTSTYAYDMSNERIKEAITSSTSTVTTYYPTKFYNITAGVPTKHVFANGVVIATISGTGASSTVTSILTDYLTGSNVVTNASGAIVELSDYYPYGATRIDDQIGFNEQRKFTGQEYDESTGLNYMHARYYDGSRGQFLSEDLVHLSIGDMGRMKKLTGQDQMAYLMDPQQFNSYSYARDNPITKSDPSGLLVQLESRPVFNIGGYYVGEHTFFLVTPDHPSEVHIAGVPEGTKAFTLGAYPGGNPLWTHLDKQIGFSDSKGMDTKYAFGNTPIINQTTITPPEGQSDTQFINNMGAQFNSMDASSYNYFGLGHLPGFYNGNSNGFAYTLGANSGVQSQMDAFSPNPGGISNYGYKPLPTTSIYKEAQSTVNSIKSNIDQFINQLKDKKH